TAKAHGCDYPVIYTREDFVARVKEITRDQKLLVVYDSVGKDTFMKSLDCLKPKGMMVSFGQSSGSVGPIDLGVFGQKGSLFFTRPTLNTYAAARSLGDGKGSLRSGALGCGQDRDQAQPTARCCLFRSATAIGPRRRCAGCHTTRRILDAWETVPRRCRDATYPKYRLRSLSRTT